MSQDLSKNHEEINKLVHDLRQLAETKSAETVETKAAMSKMESRLVELEEANNTLQKKVFRVNGAGGAVEPSEEVKSFTSFVRKKQEMITPDERKYLRTDSNPDGGYLVPTEMSNEIIKQIIEISPVRKEARVRNVSAKSLTIPKRTSIPTAYWEGEGEPYQESGLTYGSEEIPTNKLTALIVITEEQLQDAAFNMESEITSDVSETFAFGEGRGFVLGNGVKQPEGLLTNPNVPEFVTGVANALTTDAFIAMAGELKRGYDPKYMLNRRTLAKIRVMKDGMGQYIWQSGFAAGQPNTINGYGYVVANDMPDVAAGTYPVIFGDFYRGYTIIDRTQMTVIRDQYTLAAEGKVRFVFSRRVGGQVVLPEAFIKMKVSA